MKIHTFSQSEDSEYKYDMEKGFLNSNSDFGKWPPSIQTLWDWQENLTSN